MPFAQETTQVRASDGNKAVSGQFQMRRAILESVGQYFTISVRPCLKCAPGVFEWMLNSGNPLGFAHLTLKSTMQKQGNRPRALE